MRIKWDNLDKSILSSAVHTEDILISWRLWCQVQDEQYAKYPEKLDWKQRRKCSDKAEETEISLSVLTGCITRYLQGYLPGRLTSGSQIASTVGCHPLVMSHVKFKSHFVLAMGTERQAVGGSLVTDFCLHCQNGSPHLSLQHRLASPTQTSFWAH